MDKYYNQIKKEMKEKFKKKNKLVQEWVLDEYLEIETFKINYQKKIDETSKNLPNWVVKNYLKKNKV